MIDPYHYVFLAIFLVIFVLVVNVVLLERLRASRGGTAPEPAESSQYPLSGVSYAGIPVVRSDLVLPGEVYLINDNFWNPVHIDFTAATLTLDTLDTWQRGGIDRPYNWAIDDPPTDRYAAYFSGKPLTAKTIDELNALFLAAWQRPETIVMAPGDVSATPGAPTPPSGGLG